MSAAGAAGSAPHPAAPQPSDQTALEIDWALVTQFDWHNAKPATALAGLPDEDLAEGIRLFPNAKTVPQPIKSAGDNSRKREMPPVAGSPTPKSVATVQPRQAKDATDPNAALAFLDDFFGSDKRHLVAIKKSDQRIAAHHFDAADRAEQQKFITDYSAAGFDIYFSPNPIKGTLHKKATKEDVAEARYLWIDLDPRKDQPLETERAEMLPLLTTNAPEGMPRPNRVIDSGRGYWGYWRIAKPEPADGSNGSLTGAIESYGRGIEQAFGDRFADGCRNIDRIARLPGTVNTKTGKTACVLHEFSHDQPHAIEKFPRNVTKFTAERRRKIGDALRGKPKPPHEQERLRSAQLGQKASAETRAKMSATHKARGTRPLGRKQSTSVIAEGAQPTDALGMYRVHEPAAGGVILHPHGQDAAAVQAVGLGLVREPEQVQRVDLDLVALRADHDNGEMPAD